MKTADTLLFDRATARGVELYDHYYDSAIEAINDGKIEVLHEVARRWHENKANPTTDIKTIDEIILEIKKEVNP